MPTVPTVAGSLWPLTPRLGGAVAITEEDRASSSQEKRWDWRLVCPRSRVVWARGDADDAGCADSASASAGTEKVDGGRLTASRAGADSSPAPRPGGQAGEGTKSAALEPLALGISEEPMTFTEMASLVTWTSVAISSAWGSAVSGSTAVAVSRAGGGGGELPAPSLPSPPSPRSSSIAMSPSHLGGSAILSCAGEYSVIGVIKSSERVRFFPLSVGAAGMEPRRSGPRRPCEADAFIARSGTPPP